MPDYWNLRTMEQPDWSELEPERGSGTFDQVRQVAFRCCVYCGRFMLQSTKTFWVGVWHGRVARGHTVQKSGAGTDSNTFGVA